MKQKYVNRKHNWAEMQHVQYTVAQWFPNVLARDPKERLDICPGPKLVKTADLRAHNAPRYELVDQLFSLLTEHLFSNLWTFVDFSLISNDSTGNNRWILLSVHENLCFFGGERFFENVLK